MPLSTQQQAVVDFVRTGRGSTFVEAVAGSGKTTTLIASLAETTGSVNFCAYNKAIADEVKAKCAPLGLGNRVRVGTFHSFGFGAWRYKYPKVEAGPEAARKKTDLMIKEIDIPRPLQGFVTKLVGLAKQRALGLYGSVDDVSQYYAIIEHFDLANELENEELVSVGIELAIDAMKWSREVADQIMDFDDMIWIPVVSGCKIWQNDWIFVDEAQDTNPARRALARKMLKPNGRAVFVGDRHQAIYGFTGADNDAIEQIVRDFNASSIPLTVTFRCPKAVVAKAQEVVSHIQAHESAPEGSVSEMEVAQFSKVADFNPVHDAILCRNVRPLVATAYQLIKRGIACHVEGRDIGMGLIKLVNRFESRTLLDLADKMKLYAEIETEKLKAKGRETAAEALQDRVDTVMVIMSDKEVTSVDILRQKINTLFLDSDNERKPTLTLSTVHRSKGREWKRVFLYGANLYMPSPYARQQWMMAQEANLLYVSFTRAKETLILVNAIKD